MADYYVIAYSLDKRVGDEWTIFKTSDLEKAKKRARDEEYIYKRYKINGKVEVRQYAEDIDLEECTNFGYDLIEF